MKSKVSQTEEVVEKAYYIDEGHYNRIVDRPKGDTSLRSLALTRWCRYNIDQYNGHTNGPTALAQIIERKKGRRIDRREERKKVKERKKERKRDRKIER